MSCTVAALYQFHEWPVAIEVAQKELKEWCQQHNIKGSLLVAEEGINGTVSGTLEGVRKLKNHLEQEYNFNDLEYKESEADKHPFYRMKVKLKKEIVTLGQDAANPLKACGTYLEPKEWNKLIQDPDVVVIDTRNTYECEIGTFKGAIDPKTETFRDLPEFMENLNLPKDKPIAMCCTGGIRCEKSTSYLKSQGYEHVYHLKGGILKYLEEVPENESLWEGDCFVFDHRIAVSHGLKTSNYTMCYGCRHPLSQSDREHHLYEEGVSCHRCAHRSEEDKNRFRERQKQVALAEKRKTAHIGRTSEEP